MDLMHIAAVSLRNDQLRAESISQNVANVLTPGYKRQVAVVSPFAQAMAVQASDRASEATRLSFDMSAGPLRASGKSTDVAIEGQGFFEVETPTGVAFTRQGALRIDNQGRLIGSQGLPLRAAGGAFVMTGTDFSVSTTGQVRQGDRVVAQLKITQFKNTAGMTPLGSGMYAQGAAVPADEATPVTIRSGFLEGSNVNSAQEMVRLTETVRHFEAMHKVVVGYDESLEKAIRKLGEF